ncbi:MAG: HXXEE domain-containing protein [Pseudomonadota bacterium]
MRTGKNDYLATLTVALLFVMLWVPLGQHDFLLAHWMKVGTFAAPFLLITYFTMEQGSSGTSNRLFMAVALLTVYIVHQFEEHWVDALGNRYAFYGYVNSLVRALFADDDPSVAPLTREAIFVINTSLVWLVGVIALLRARQRLFPLLALAAITLVNGLTHIIAGVATLSYNPGLLSSIMLFLPISIAFFVSIVKTQPELKPLLVGSIVWAILAHVLMVAGMLAANLFGLISELVYFVLLIVWSASPLVVSK